MAKGKKGGKGKKAKKEKVVDPNALTEVDKTFYELTITDLNRKLARLRSLTQELEIKNEELQQEKEKLDEDRNDIIIYLKRTLQERTDENRELEERITALQETRENETEKYELQIADMKEEYHEMHDQLKSENKLLEGKLNALEEFRSQRDDLMKKFENQENMIEEQEKRHKREIYEIERKFVIKQDQLKRDMEAKLRDLSTKFHDTTEMRIAATTHRVIRENIAVNNELDLVLTTQQKLFNENVKMKRKDTNFKQQIELLEVEKRKALATAKVQLRVIEKLTDDHQFMLGQIEKYKHYEEEVFNSRGAIRNLENVIEELNHTKKILEQNLHHVRTDRVSIQTQLLYSKAENDHLNNILNEAVCCIKDAMLMPSESDTWLHVSRRENLLNTLFTLLTEAREHRMRLPSLETVDSIEATYKMGDLGFIPKPVELRSKVPTKKHMESQTDVSFEEYLRQDETDRVAVEIKSSLRLDGAKSLSRAQMKRIEMSVMFFDDTEIIEEEEGSQDLALMMIGEEEQEEEESGASPTTDTETAKESPTETESPVETSPEPQASPEAQAAEASPDAPSPEAKPDAPSPEATPDASPPEASPNAADGQPPEEVETEEPAEAAEATE